ncbi:MULTISPECIES: hypothetical protein [unclassified Pseudomonas]|uniref:hypothetical protein n=1 Tax=unclassified Pseudomonas TaxID=196821 RepID=UPI0025FDA6A8|nr:MULTISPECIES: hypothetical protein [unclassified Pseudomonas]
MSFLEFIQAGMDKATEAKSNIKAVDLLLTDISKEIKVATNKEIRLQKTTSLIASLKRTTASFDTSSAPTEFFDSDQLCLALDNTLVSVARWRQSKEGFPCILTLDGAEFICNNINELADAMKILLSSAKFGKTLTDLMKS